MTNSKQKQVVSFLYPQGCSIWTPGFSSWILQQYFPPSQFWDYVFSHIFSQGCESTVLGSHSPFFSLVEEIPLEFGIALGMHTVCPAYASNSFSFTVYNTPQQGQMQFWAN